MMEFHENSHESEVGYQNGTIVLVTKRDIGDMERLSSSYEVIRVFDVAQQGEPARLTLKHPN